MKSGPLIWLHLCAWVAALACPVQATEVTSTPISSQQAEDALIDAAGGEVFHLASVLPRIEDPGLAWLARARLAAARLDAVEAGQLVDRYLADGNRTPAQRALAWPIVADASFAVGDYHKAAEAAHAWEQALAAEGAAADKRADALQMATLADQLASATAQHVDVYTPKPEAVKRDKVGLPRSLARINGKPQEVVLDTGANLSVVSLSTAHKLGLRLLEGATSVGSASRQAVASRIGVADHLTFAGLSLSHVAFLVLDDQQLNMPVPGGYQIDAILGFPVLRQLQRLEFTSDGKLLPSHSSASKPGEGNLRMAGSDLYVEVILNDLPVAMHLDSGGAFSSLSSRFASEHPDVVKGLKSRQDHIAGAGGARARQSATWPQVRVRIGDQQTVLPAMTISLSDAGNVKEPNVLGGDILQSFDHWTIDFPRMQFDVGKPLSHATTKPHAG
ncbi:retropepsin-like aspartic protease [Dyella japonica]|uniref:Aspartyl protease n=1 Tax=Dyella japonica TaxID=231455 RepID=A0ABV2K2V0_9GAMM